MDKKIGEYHLIDFIEPGGSSAVYRASQRGSKEEVAIKIMRDRFPNRDQTLMKTFKKEVEVLKKLDHEHIVKIIEVIFDNTDYDQMARPCIVMPYIPGGTLRKLLNNHDLLSLETIRSYIRQITKALQYAHDRNVFHCDVKPENILLSEDGSCLFLADFGIAQILSEIHSTTHVTTKPSGTAEYMSPEQFDGHPSPKSDQYALAILLYECLCGSLPFKGTNYNQLSKQHYHAQVPSLRQKCRNRQRNISKRTEQAILKALTKDKEKRYSNIETFAEALDKALTLEIEEEQRRNAEQAQQVEEGRHISVTKTIVWSVGIILIVLSQFLLPDWSIRGIYNAASFYDGTQSTQGIVTDSQLTLENDGRNGYESCSISVTFTLVGKTSPTIIQEYLLTLPLTASTCPDKGAKVEVLYYPRNPADAKTTQKVDEDIMTNIVGTGCLLVLALLVIALLADRINSRYNSSIKLAALILYS